MVASRQTAVQPGASPRAPDRPAQMFRLRSPFLLNLRRHPELDGMQKPGQAAGRKNEQTVVPARRGRPFLLPRLRVAEKIDFTETARVRLLRGEIREQLQGRARRGVVVCT